MNSPGTHRIPRPPGATPGRAAPPAGPSSRAEARSFRDAADEIKRGKAAESDGGYLLETAREDLTAGEVWRIYILLT
jgi:hypothetical protein